jgi:hypothetical protein
MHFNIILPFNVLLFYLIIFNNFYTNGEKSYLRFRNSILRIYIASGKKKYELINEYSNKIVEKVKNKVINKYYDLNIYYNSLSEEEKTFLDFIISLYY